jgi:hypothetical protein
MITMFRSVCLCDDAKGGAAPVVGAALHRPGGGVARAGGKWGVCRRSPAVAEPAQRVLRWWLGAGLALAGVGGGWAQAAPVGPAGVPPRDAKTSGSAATPFASEGALPEGDRGLAARYPGDQGIAADPAVLFADDFETPASPRDLPKTWDVVHHVDHLRLTTAPTDVYGGKQALELTVPQQEREFSHAVDKILARAQSVLFLRYYSKFQPPYDVVGSSHNGCSISGGYYDGGRATPGVPADGRNKFLVNLENWRGEAATRSPGFLNLYVYHPEQRSQWGDHLFPTGVVLPNSSRTFDFGPSFERRQDIIPALDRWHCCELMVALNTPGRRDGRLAFWFDGVLSGDFGNLRLRDVEGLKIDRFGLHFHIGSNPRGVARKWYDNVVAATTYIGPLVRP